MSEPKPQFTPSEALVNEVMASMMVHSTRELAARAVIKASGLGKCVDALEGTLLTLENARHALEKVGLTEMAEGVERRIQWTQDALAQVRGEGQ